MSDVEFVKVDSQSMHQDLIISFQTALKDVLYPGDERLIYIENFMPVLVGIYNAINTAGKMTLLKYAYGTYLDAIGEDRQVTRLSEQKAIVTQRFTLSVPQPSNYEIPIGTRVTIDGQLTFETTETLYIPAGEISGTTIAKALLPGSKYNGFLPGMITTIVDRDRIPAVTSSANTEITAGGAETEDDESYRERIRQAPGVYSTAGCYEGYIYHAKSANTGIADVYAESPTAGEVEVYVLMQEGETTSAIIAAVTDALNDRKVRPLTDSVTVAAPEEVSYMVNLIYYIAERDAETEAEIKTRVEASIDEYIVWQKGVLGRAINPDKLRQMVLQAGACRVDVSSPAVYTPLLGKEVGALSSKTVSYGGLLSGA